jgi:polysaccharide pyruvyl transferase WcaK-like protein
MTGFFYILQKLYEKSIFRMLIHGIWTIFNLIKLSLFCIFNNQIIYHYGIFGMYRNIGDRILYDQIEKLFDNYFSRSNIWYNRIALGEISHLEILLINKYCSMLIVGGHGLLMPESNMNSNSGWGFNIKTKNLKKINIPIIFFAIGYNVFRNKDKFIPIFNEHINECVKKSLFFGLRNYGSINKIKTYLPNDLYSKIVYQPCPTTLGFLKQKTPKTNMEKTDKIAISVAFNKTKNRYNNNLNRILNQLVDYGKNMQKRGFKVIFFGHHLFDVHSKYANFLKKQGFHVLPLYEYSIECIYELYQQNKLIISMRGHGLMIPFGLSLPAISLTNQDKQKWFLETIGHTDWSIDINSNFYEELIQKTFEILDNYNAIQQALVTAREYNQKITKENFEFINSNYLFFVKQFPGKYTPTPP